MRSHRAGHLVILALGAAGVSIGTGCSGHVASEPPSTTSGPSSSNASSSGGQTTPDASPDASVPVDCAGIAVPQTAYLCPSGDSITGTYVPDNGACVLVYNCPPPQSEPVQDAGVPTLPVNDAGNLASCGVGIGPCASWKDAGNVGATYPCGAGLSCTCNGSVFTPAPCNAAGQQVGLAYNPPPGPVTPYSNMAEFNAVAVGRWRRIAGEAELECEEVGIEITAQQTWMPLVTASDGSVQAVQNLAQPIGLTFGSGKPVIPGNNAPVFYDACGGPGTGMQLLIDPWYADYVKMP
jgi:hypothetical protein